MTETFGVTDLYKAGFLLLRGHPVTTTRLPSGRVRFDFPLTAIADAQAFERGAAITAIDYADALRRTKRMLAPSNSISRIEVERKNAPSYRS